MAAFETSMHFGQLTPLTTDRLGIMQNAAHLGKLFFQQKKVKLIRELLRGQEVYV